MYYQVNPESIIFLRTDFVCGFSTIAYDWTSDDIFFIKPSEYRILKFISDNQPVKIDSLMDLLDDDGEKQTLMTMLETFTQKKILSSYE
ncbi:hypothetical protein HYU91_03370 [Candidatus Collierbacteria bacterium]|nr:hypothetical protein [Candidatus Collierbacteria bacterium]